MDSKLAKEYHALRKTFYHHSGFVHRVPARDALHTARWRADTRHKWDKLADDARVAVSVEYDDDSLDSILDFDCCTTSHGSMHKGSQYYSVLPGEQFKPCGIEYGDCIEGLSPYEHAPGQCRHRCAVIAKLQQGEYVYGVIGTLDGEHVASVWAVDDYEYACNDVALEIMAEVVAVAEEREQAASAARRRLAYAAFGSVA